MYEVRITDEYFKAQHQDGETYLHTSINEVEMIAKSAINANYEDIQKIQDGTLLAGKAKGLTTSDGLSEAELSLSTVETLQSDDGKIPTAKQVKDYIDAAIAAL